MTANGCVSTAILWCKYRTSSQAHLVEAYADGLTSQTIADRYITVR